MLKFNGVCVVVFEMDCGVVLCEGKDVEKVIESKFGYKSKFEKVDGLVGFRFDDVEEEDECGGCVVEVSELNFDKEVLIKVSDCGMGFEVVEDSDEYDLYDEDDCDISIDVVSDLKVLFDSYNVVVKLIK